MISRFIIAEAFGICCNIEVGRDGLSSDSLRLQLGFRSLEVITL